MPIFLLVLTLFQIFSPFINRMKIFQIKNLVKSFNQKDNVIDDVSLSFDSTGLVGILGKSGCGKSTFLNIILGIEKPTSGSVLYFNEDISLYNDKKFSSYHLNDISIIFQHYNLFLDLSALDNVIIPSLMKGVKKDDAIEKATFLFKEFEMESLINQKAKDLSGGEKQRVGILRSLINDQKVILSDEPTGALDKKNSKAVMEMFKKISKDKLVIVVSHNKELIDKYADRIIYFHEGKIKEDKLINETQKYQYKRKDLSKYSSKWTSLFFKSYLKQNKHKNIFSLIAISIGFIGVFLSFGFSNGSKASEEEALKNNLSISYAKASESSYFEIENSPLKYEKSVRPSVELIDEKLGDIDGLIFEPSLSYAFSSFPVGHFNDGFISGFEMVPLYTIDEALDLSDVIINDEMAKLLGISLDDTLDEMIKISSKSVFKFSSGDYLNPFIKDEVDITLNLRVIGTVKEFSFLNTPKIYYSYTHLKNYLKSVSLRNISAFKKKNVSVFEYIVNAKNDDDVTSFTYNVFISDEIARNKLFDYINNLKDEEILKVSSQALEIKKAYTEFINTFSNALFVFIIIAFIGVNLILGMFALSNFIERKKESAILTCLGGKNSSLVKLYLKQNFYLVTFSIIFGAILSLPFQYLINHFVDNRFGLSNLIDIPFLSYFGIPFLLILGVYLIALFISSLFTMTPLFLYRKISLTDELRDE